eukprot:Colp12_sorted_trinity150504_noHs@34636
MQRENMGNFFSKKKETKPAEAEKPKYSWEKRDRPDPKDYMFSKLKGQTVGKLPGKINGLNFVIEDCEDCFIYLFDYIDSVQIDACKNCTIVIGPVKGSVFLRELTNCKCIIACQQFRTRDCKNMDTYLYCMTRPIIESSSKLRFGCLQLSYPEFEAHFKAAGLEIFNNDWSDIYDFSPSDGANFSFMPEDTNMEDFIPKATEGELAAVQWTSVPDSSLVPISIGKRPKPSGECVFVAYFLQENPSAAQQLLVALKDTAARLVQSKQIAMSADDAARVFGGDHRAEFAAAASKAPVIALEFVGENILELVKEKAAATTDKPVYVAPDATAANADVNAFFTFANMQMR